jgi:Rieske Fe-S protein
VTERLNRRQAIAGAAVVGVGVPLLAACGGDETGAAGSATASDTAASGPSSAGSDSVGGNGGASDALAQTADIEVGGAVFLEEPSVVITQPTAGDFRAFNRACTHQGCPVTDLVDGNIHCACHNSMFSATDGSVVEGPAQEALETVAITVEGGAIVAG